MFTLGLDFGTNSVRALVVRCSDGAEYGSRVVDYPSGTQGVLLDPNDGHLARQYPGDYLFGLEESVKGALAEAGGQARLSAPRKSSASASTRPDRARFRSTTRTARWRSASSGRTIFRPSAGCGRTTPAGAKRPRSPSSARRSVRNTSPSAAASIRRNGSGPRSGIASTSRRRCSKRPIRGSKSPTGSRPFSPASRTRFASSAASAPPATRRSTRTNGAACPTRNF